MKSEVKSPGPIRETKLDNSGVNLFLPHLRPKFDLTFDATRQNKTGIDSATPRSTYRKQIIKSVLDNKQKYAVQTLIGDPRNTKNGENPIKYKLNVREMIKQGQKNAFDEFGLEGYPDGKYPAFDARQDKPIEFSVPQDQKPRTFIDKYVKDHSLDPGPKYQIELNMSKQSVTYKNCPKYKVPSGIVPDHLDAIKKLAA